MCVVFQQRQIMKLEAQVASTARNHLIETNKLQAEVKSLQSQLAHAKKAQTESSSNIASVRCSKLQSAC